MFPFAKKLLRSARKIGVTNLQRFEARLLSKYTVPEFAPIFIIGPPRSGTTLIYQALVCRYRLSYFCNLANRFAVSPALATRLLARSMGINPPLSFESRYGETKRLRSPSQANRIWGRWFPGPQRFFSAGELTAEAVDEMQRTLACIEHDTKAPFASKSIGHAVRIQPLVRAFPQAVFLRIRRSHQQIVESILSGRREYFGDENMWFSVRPSNYENSKHLPIIPQICAQVLGIESDIDRDLDLSSRQRVFEISYDEFCRDPVVALREFADQYEDLTSTRFHTRFDIPMSFPASTRTRVDNQDQQAIAAELSTMTSPKKVAY